MEINVLFSQSLLIRPGFVYTICVGKFSDEHVSYVNELKQNIQLDADINIQTNNCLAKNGIFFDLISMLNVSIEFRKPLQQ